MKLTIGDLRKYLETHNPPDDALVLVERVQDMYFEKHGWESIEKEVDNFEIHEYVEASCTCTYKNDGNLYINAHY